MTSLAIAIACLVGILIVTYGTTAAVIAGVLVVVVGAGSFALGTRWAWGRR